MKTSSCSVPLLSVVKKCQMVSLKCPPGLQEDHFLDLLRSSLPQLHGDDRPVEFFSSDQRRRLQPLKLKSLTPEEIHTNLKPTGPGKSAVYIRLQVGLH